jgi:hypothetical protein
MQNKYNPARLFTGPFSKVILIVIFLLVAVRVALPIGIKYEINKYLGSHLKEYTGSIENFDLALYRGAYQVQGLKIWKLDSNSVPLLQVDEIDMSLAWRALWHRKILADIVVNEPRVNLIDSKKKEKTQYGNEQKDLHKILSKLVLFDIESFSVRNGTFRFINYDLKVPAEVVADRIQLHAHNIKNSLSSEELLPSSLDVTGYLQGEYFFELHGSFNLMSEIPSLDARFELKDFQLNSLNPILLAYLPLSFTRGTLSVYAEVASKDGKILGYVKPFFKKVKVISKDEKFKSVRHFGFEIVTAAGNLLFRNGKTLTTATRVAFHGNIRDPKVNTGEALKLSFENAFGDPSIAEGFDNSVDIRKL